MSKYLAAAAFAGLLLATTTSVSALPRQPQNTNETVPSADQPKDKDAAKDRKYCVTDTRPASHITQRVCKTRTEWMAQGFDPLNP